MFNSYKSNENNGFNDILYNHNSYNEIFQKKSGRLKMWMIWTIFHNISRKVSGDGENVDHVENI